MKIKSTPVRASGTTPPTTSIPSPSPCAPSGGSDADPRNFRPTTWAAEIDDLRSLASQGYARGGWNRDEWGALEEMEQRLELLEKCSESMGLGNMVLRIPLPQKKSRFLAEKAADYPGGPPKPL